jgi:type_I_sec_HlyB: type I secretion system ATPase
MAEKILEVQNLKKTFFIREKILHGCEDVSFFLNAGEVLGIVGESGSGKSQWQK